MKLAPADLPHTNGRSSRRPKKAAVRSKALGRTGGQSSNGAAAAHHGRPDDGGLSHSNDDFMRQLNAALTAIVEGDFSARVSADWPGMEGRVAENLNAITSRLERSNRNLLHLQHQVGERGENQRPHGHGRLGRQLGGTNRRDQRPGR